jgi:hypothetical protein
MPQNVSVPGPVPVVFSTDSPPSSISDDYEAGNARIIHAVFDCAVTS